MERSPRFVLIFGLTVTGIRYTKEVTLGLHGVMDTQGCIFTDAISVRDHDASCKIACYKMEISLFHHHLSENKSLLVHWPLLPPRDPEIGGYSKSEGSRGT
jgi:hypothetical protein